jgi:hypothetical protein
MKKVKIIFKKEFSRPPFITTELNIVNVERLYAKALNGLSAIAEIEFVEPENSKSLKQVQRIEPTTGKQTPSWKPSIFESPMTPPVSTQKQIDTVKKQVIPKEEITDEKLIEILLERKKSLTAIYWFLFRSKPEAKK